MKGFVQCGYICKRDGSKGTILEITCNSQIKQRYGACREGTWIKSFWHVMWKIGVLICYDPNFGMLSSYWQIEEWIFYNLFPFLKYANNGYSRVSILAHSAKKPLKNWIATRIVDRRAVYGNLPRSNHIVIYSMPIPMVLQPVIFCAFPANGSKRGATPYRNDLHRWPWT